MGPFTPCVSFWDQLLVLAVRIPVHPRNFVRWSRPSRIGSESLVFEGGGGRRVGVFYFIHEVVLVAVMCCQAMTSFSVFLFLITY